MYQYCGGNFLLVSHESKKCLEDSGDTTVKNKLLLMSTDLTSKSYVSPLSSKNPERIESKSVQVEVKHDKSIPLQL